MMITNLCFAIMFTAEIFHVRACPWWAYAIPLVINLICAAGKPKKPVLRKIQE